MGSEVKPKCETCRFWYAGRHPRDKNKGQCRRHAPRNICGTGTGWSDWEWPATGPLAWCGEWNTRHGEEGED